MFCENADLGNAHNSFRYRYCNTDTVYTYTRNHANEINYLREMMPFLREMMPFSQRASVPSNHNHVSSVRTTLFVADVNRIPHILSKDELARHCTALMCTCCQRLARISHCQACPLKVATTHMMTHSTYHTHVLFVVIQASKEKKKTICLVQ